MSNLKATRFSVQTIDSKFNFLKESVKFTNALDATAFGLNQPVIMGELAVLVKFEYDRFGEANNAEMLCNFYNR